MDSKPQVVIIGAGRFGREVQSWLMDVPSAERGWEFKGFLDDRVDAFAKPVLGRIADYSPGENDVFLCAIGASKVRAEITRALEAKGWKFKTFIHPTARVDPLCKVGDGVIIGPFAYVGVGAVIGDHAIINVSSSVGHDSILGRSSTLSPHVDITGSVEVGEACMFGSHGSVLPCLVVGAGATVGAGSVAIRNVQPNATVFGVPAKRLV